MEQVGTGEVKTELEGVDNSTVQPQAAVGNVMGVWEQAPVSLTETTDDSPSVKDRLLEKRPKPKGSRTGAHKKGKKGKKSNKQHVGTERNHGAFASHTWTQGSTVLQPTPSLLEEVLNEKKLALMKSPEVIKHLQMSQQNLSNRKSSTETARKNSGSVGNYFST